MAADASFCREIAELRDGMNAALRRFMRFVITLVTVCYACVQPAPTAGEEGPGGGGVDAGTEVAADATADDADAAPQPRFPDETVTGWTPSGQYETIVGTHTLDEDGAVFEDVDLGGCLVITAQDVTVRRVRIRCQGTGITVGSGASATIEDVTVDGEGAGQQAVNFQGTGAMRRLDVHGYKRGVQIQSTTDVTFEDSYVHAPVACSTPVDDESSFYQLRAWFSSRITIRHNHLDRGAADTCTDQQHHLGAHAVSLGNAYENNIFEDNLIDGGSGFCVWIGNTCDNFAVRNNHFGNKAHATCAIKGPAESQTPFDSEFADNCEWSGNVWDASGEPVPAP